MLWVFNWHLGQGIGRTPSVRQFFQWLWNDERGISSVELTLFVSVAAGAFVLTKVLHYF